MTVPEELVIPVMAATDLVQQLGMTVAEKLKKEKDTKHENSEKPHAANAYAVQR